MNQEEKWLKWAMEIQAIAQNGLWYGKDEFDKERYTRLRELSVEILSEYTEISKEKVYDLFCTEFGYQTPKLDTRAAIFKDEKILLVQEKDGRWSLPGGWVDFDLSIRENTIKEVKEEAGLEVECQNIIALHDRKRHNLPIYPYNICKVFVLCKLIGGQFQENSETLGFQYFALNELPELSGAKNTAEQIALCFQAKNDPNWQVVFD